MVLECHFSWQAQYLVMLQRLFLWQVEFLAKFGMMAGDCAPRICNERFTCLSAKSRMSFFVAGTVCCKALYVLGAYTFP